MKHIEYTFTTGMDDSAVDDHLRTAESGVLTLCGDGEPHAVPLVHYYDGERLYFRLGITEGSRKQELWEQTETACYVLHGTEPTDDPRAIDSWSIVVNGPLVEVPDSEHERFDTAEINRRFSPIRVFDEAIEEIQVLILALEIDTITGRVTSDGAQVG